MYASYMMLMSWEDFLWTLHEEEHYDQSVCRKLDNILNSDKFKHLELSYFALKPLIDTTQENKEINFHHVDHFLKLFETE